MPKKSSLGKFRWIPVKLPGYYNIGGSFNFSLQIFHDITHYEHLLLMKSTKLKAINMDSLLCTTIDFHIVHIFSYS